MSTARNWDLKRYCKEYQKIENYEKAISSSEIYDLHHRLEFAPFSGKRISSKRLKELGLYYNQKPEALIFLGHSEHTALHSSGRSINVSEETRKKISESLKGHTLPEETCRKISETMKGIPKSEETKRRMIEARKKRGLVSDETKRRQSESHKGKHWKLIDGKRVWY